MEKQVKLCHVRDVFRVQSDDATVFSWERKAEAGKCRFEGFEFLGVGSGYWGVIVGNYPSQEDGQFADVVIRTADRSSCYDGGYQVFEVMGKWFNHDV